MPVRAADRATAGQQQNLSKLSRGERAIINLTGAAQADPRIRNLVEKDTAKLFEEDKSLTDKLVFWHSKGKFGTVVDPVKERRRIHEVGQALGKPLNSNRHSRYFAKEKSLI